MNDDYLTLKEQLGNLFFLIKTLFRVNKRLFFIRFPLIVLQTVSSIMTIWFMKLILNEIAGGIDVKYVILLSALMAGAAFFVKLISRIISAFDKKESVKTEYRLKLILADAIMSLPYRYAVEPRTLNFLEMAKKENSFSTVLSSVSDFIASIITAITYAAVIISINPIILILIILNVGLDGILLRKKAKKDYKQENEMFPVYRKLWALLNVLDKKEYGKEVRINRLKDWAVEKGRKQSRKALEFEKKGTKLDVFFAGAQELAGNILNAATYLILAFLFIFRNLLIGDFTYGLNCMLNLSGNIKGVISGWNTLLNHGLFSRGFRYCINLSETNKASEDNNAKCNLEDIKDFSIEFRNVCFTYPGSKTAALKNICFKIEDGETLSLVGVNGSGKTTLVMLICRFYEPDEGEILLGGMPINKIPYQTYCKFLGVSFQNNRFFSGTIAENIAFGDKFDVNKVKECLEISGLTEKINTLPDGILSTLGREFDENGTDFSGGEKQKLSISRAVYSEPKIMIFDEPTASLDPIAEYEIISNLRKATEKNTSIIISHRLSSAKASDKIAVLSEGELCEFGTHAELYEKEDGIYRQLFRAQSQYYK